VIEGGSVDLSYGKWRTEKENYSALFYAHVLHQNSQKYCSCRIVHFRCCMHAHSLPSGIPYQVTGSHRIVRRTNEVIGKGQAACSGLHLLNTTGHGQLVALAGALSVLKQPYALPWDMRLGEED
jgi:hypothetical protein